MMKSLIRRLAFLVSFLCFPVHAIQIENFNLSPNNFKKALELAQTKYPKFWRHLLEAEHDRLVVQFTNHHVLPFGRAKGTNTIRLSAVPILEGARDFPDEKMLIIFWHELGHIKFNQASKRQKISKRQGEYEAFYFSLQKAIYAAKSDDKATLRLLVSNLEKRALQGNPKSFYTLALKALMKDNIWHIAKAIIQEGES